MSIFSAETLLHTKAKMWYCKLQKLWYLFCIASTHNSLLSYRWHNLHGDLDLLSPVYYAHKSGIYKCTVDDRFGNKCYFKSIEVTDGTLISDLMFIIIMQHYRIFVASFKMVLADDELSASPISIESTVVDSSSTVSGGMTDSHQVSITASNLCITNTQR